MYEGKYEYINIYTLYVYTCFSLILETLSVMYSLLGDKKQLLWESLSFIKSTWRCWDPVKSNETRAPGCFGYIGDEILPNYVGDYNKPLEGCLVKQPI